MSYINRTAVPASNTIIIAKEGQSLNPQWADIVLPSGSTSDQTQINNALSDLPAVGGTLLFLEGEYTIDGNINLLSNVTIQGQGNATTIKIIDSISSNISMLLLDGIQNTKIIDIALDGNKTNRSSGTQKCIEAINSCSNINIRGVRFTDVNDNCIDFVSCEHSIIHFSHFDNSGAVIDLNLQAGLFNIVSDNIFNNSGNASLTAGAVGSSFYNNIINNPGGDGINVTGNRCMFEGNKIASAGNFAFDVNSVSLVKITDTTIFNPSNAGINAQSIQECIISDNCIDSCGGNGITIGGASDNNSIKNNKVSNNTTDGIQLSDSGTGTYNHISGNKVHDNNQNGIDVSNQQYASIIGNMVSDINVNGLNINAVEDSIINSNHVSASSRAANATYDNLRLVQNCNNNMVSENVCRLGNNANQPLNGLAIENSNDSDNVVSNNDLRNSGTSNSLLDNGTGTITTAGNHL